MMKKGVSTTNYKKIGEEATLAAETVKGGVNNKLKMMMVVVDLVVVGAEVGGDDD